MIQNEAENFKIDKKFAIFSLKERLQKIFRPNSRQTSTRIIENANVVEIWQ